MEKYTMEEKILAYFPINYKENFMESLHELVDSVDGYDVVIRNVWNDGDSEPEVELEGTSESLKQWYSKMIAKGPVSDEEWEDWKEANL